MVSPDSDGAPHDRVAPPEKDPPMTSSHAPRHALTRLVRRLPLAVAGVALGMLAVGLVPQPLPVAAETFTWSDQGCPNGGTLGNYVVPDGTRFVQVVAIGGTGAGGASYNSNNTGGAPGSGAQVTAILPVTSG